MARYRLALDRAALTGVARLGGGRLVVDTARRTLALADVTCPVDTGRLRSSSGIQPALRGSAGPRATVEYRARYAAAVHGGRRAVTIRPRRKSALKFQVGGRTVYASVVHQPARAGRPWLYRALVAAAVPRGFTVIRL